MEQKAKEINKLNQQKIRGANEKSLDYAENFESYLTERLTSREKMIVNKPVKIKQAGVKKESLDINFRRNAMASVNKWEDFRQRRALITRRFIALKYHGRTLKRLIVSWYARIFLKSIYQRFHTHRTGSKLRMVVSMHRMSQNAKRSIRGIDD